MSKNLDLLRSEFSSLKEKLNELDGRLQQLVIREATFGHKNPRPLWQHIVDILKEIHEPLSVEEISELLREKNEYGSRASLKSFSHLIMHALRVHKDVFLRANSKRDKPATYVLRVEG